MRISSAENSIYGLEPIAGLSQNGLSQNSYGARFCVLLGFLGPGTYLIVSAMKQLRILV